MMSLTGILTQAERNSVIERLHREKAYNRFTCPRCGQTIYPGQPVTHYLDDTYGHPGCIFNKPVAWGK